MKTMKLLRRTAAQLLALALTLALVSTPALAVEKGEDLHIEDNVWKRNVYDLSKDGTELEPFHYDVPEGGMAVLIFFKSGCGNCRQLFSTIARGALADDPRVNIVAVSVEEDRAATQNFVDTYMGGKVSHVFYRGLYMLSTYADAVLDGSNGGIGTAFVLLVANEDGKPYIRWRGESIYQGKTIQEKVDQILDGSGQVQMTKDGESIRDGRVCLLASLRNPASGPVSGTLYAVGYTGGRMTDVQSLPLTLPAGGSVQQDFTVKGETAKLSYLEEGTLRPLSGALTAGG